ncbi:hypothetical protein CPB84DRAFT_1850444 [Gymnopilus junonius]|uniref:Sm domain-containing protein n=1 Tax=Gymnopilus junonius TaxID=109634 RepID=A0A9P5NIE9_GYMJU|nr:hypothetical protein CPB84DRAFT_1850444 [Gymnopilus junonius]
MASLPPPPSPSPSSSPTSKSPSPPSSALGRLRSLLRELLRISTVDGRIFLGTFAGTDKPLNIILINAEEYRTGPEADPDGRYVGQVMLPWKVITKVEAHIPGQRPPRNGCSDSLYIWCNKKLFFPTATVSPVNTKMARLFRPVVLMQWDTPQPDYSI